MNSKDCFLVYDSLQWSMVLMTIDSKADGIGEIISASAEIDYLSNYMDKKLINEFETILGKDRVLSETEELLCYSYDATSKDFMPEIVVFPLNSEEISTIVKLCLKYNTPVVGRDAGS